MGAFLMILTELVRPAAGQVQNLNGKHIAAAKLYYGAAYYPEAWPENEIDRDIVRMKEVHMNVMRLAEFAWSSMEPREGEYDFGWLHRAIAKLHANGIDVILGTPTCTPPAWLTEKYPEVMRVNDDGSRQVHGGRRDYSYTSATYRRLSRRMVERMAQEFGSEPGVIGWQTDNEFGLSPDFSPETLEAWHRWLKARYGSIDELNRRWGLALWSQTYNSFEQIPAPTRYAWHHPSLIFNWLRFTNGEIVSYQAEQLEALRKYSRLPITHDSMPGQPVDYERLMANLDFMAFNVYHSYDQYWLIASNYDRLRSFGKGMHWLTETAPNNAGSTTASFIHAPVGGLRAAVWMNHALGGQGSLYWLWRQHRTGQEMTHGSVINAWGKPVANFEALKQIGAELKKASNFLMDAPVVPAEVAIVYSHEASFGIDVEPYMSGVRYYTDWSKRFYLPLFDAHLHRDVIMPSHDVTPYKMVFAPMLPYIPTEMRVRLKRWVTDGGTLVLGPMSGYRDADWTAFPDHALGDLESWIGAEVEARLPTGTGASLPSPIKLTWESGLLESPADLWVETLSTATGRVLARYQGGMVDGQPAIVESPVGRGKVVLLGTDPGPEALRNLLLRLAGEAGIAPVAKGDGGVVAVPRAGTKTRGTVLVNLTGEAKRLTLPEAGGTDLLSGKAQGQDVTLPPYGVLVLQK